MLTRLEDGTSVDILVFQNVKNSAQLKAKLLSGELDCALINPKVVLVAAQLAHHRDKTGKRTTRTLHSEVVYSLSAQRSIRNAFKTFGFDDNQDQVLAIAIHASSETLKELRALVDGDEVDDVDHFITSGANASRIKSLYQVTENELAVATLLSSVVTRIAAQQLL